MTDHHRRRIDQVLAPDFCQDVTSLELDEIRRRRDLAEEVEREMSYHRRLLHGRMDLLAFELRRRRGEETRSIIEALPDILAAGLTSGAEVGNIRHVIVDLDLPEVTGRREIDHVLEDDALTKVTSMSEEKLAEVQRGLAAVEEEVSQRRRRLHTVIDTLQSEIIDRYKRGLAQTDISS